MREQGQATVEYAGLCLLVALLLLAGAAAATGALAPRHPRGDAAWLAAAARYAPLLAVERGDGGELPVDFRRCRQAACSRPAANQRPVLFLHHVRRGGFTYLEYWEYLPDSRTAHLGVPLLDGAHRDDWEGLIVKLAADGSVVGARASAHLGWNGRHPWWQLARDDWAPYPATVYRAAGSHAGSFSPRGVDVAGDAWNGTELRVRPRLLAADRARRAPGAAAFDPGAVAPWEKEAWSDPETTVTGRPGDRARYARYARWWAELCRIC
jgi:hypothetical protein